MRTGPPHGEEWATTWGGLGHHGLGQHVGRTGPPRGEDWATTWGGLGHHVGRTGPPRGEDWATTWGGLGHHVGRTGPPRGEDWATTWGGLGHHGLGHHGLGHHGLGHHGLGHHGLGHHGLGHHGLGHHGLGHHGLGQRYEIVKVKEAKLARNKTLFIEHIVLQLFGEFIIRISDWTTNLKYKEYYTYSIEKQHNIYAIHSFGCIYLNIFELRWFGDEWAIGPVRPQI